MKNKGMDMREREATMAVIRELAYILEDEDFNDSAEEGEQAKEENPAGSDGN